MAALTTEIFLNVIQTLLEDVRKNITSELRQVLDNQVKDMLNKINKGEKLDQKTLSKFLNQLEKAKTQTPNQEVKENLQEIIDLTKQQQKNLHKLTELSESSLKVQKDSLSKQSDTVSSIKTVSKHTGTLLGEFKLYAKEFPKKVTDVLSSSVKIAASIPVRGIENSFRRVAPLLSREVQQVTQPLFNYQQQLERNATLTEHVLEFSLYNTKVITEKTLETITPYMHDFGSLMDTLSFNLFSTIKNVLDNLPGPLLYLKNLIERLGSSVVNLTKSFLSLSFNLSKKFFSYGSRIVSGFFSAFLPRGLTSMFSGPSSADEFFMDNDVKFARLFEDVHATSINVFSLANGSKLLLKNTMTLSERILQFPQMISKTILSSLNPLNWVKVFVKGFKFLAFSGLGAAILLPRSVRNSIITFIARFFPSETRGTLRRLFSGAKDGLMPYFNNGLGFFKKYGKTIFKSSYSLLKLVNPEFVPNLIRKISKNLIIDYFTSVHKRGFILGTITFIVSKTLKTFKSIFWKTTKGLFGLMFKGILAPFKFTWNLIRHPFQTIKKYREQKKYEKELVDKVDKGLSEKGILGTIVDLLTEEVKYRKQQTENFVKKGEEISDEEWNKRAKKAAEDLGILIFGKERFEEMKKGYNVVEEKADEFYTAAKKSFDDLNQYVKENYKDWYQEFKDKILDPLYKRWQKYDDWYEKLYQESVLKTEEWRNKIFDMWKEATEKYEILRQIDDFLKGTKEWIFDPFKEEVINYFKKLKKDTESYFSVVNEIATRLTKEMPEETDKEFALKWLKHKQEMFNIIKEDLISRGQELKDLLEVFHKKTVQPLVESGLKEAKRVIIKFFEKLKDEEFRNEWKEKLFGNGEGSLRATIFSELDKFNEFVNEQTKNVKQMYGTFKDEFFKHLDVFTDKLTKKIDNVLKDVITTLESIVTPFETITVIQEKIVSILTSLEQKLQSRITQRTALVPVSPESKALVPTPPPPGEEELPHLASGALITKKTQAVIGESGPEAIVPLTAFENKVDKVFTIIYGKLFDQLKVFFTDILSKTSAIFSDKFDYIAKLLECSCLSNQKQVALAATQKMDIENLVSIVKNQNATTNELMSAAKKPKAQRITRNQSVLPSKERVVNTLVKKGVVKGTASLIGGIFSDLTTKVKKKVISTGVDLGISGARKIKKGLSSGFKTVKTWGSSFFDLFRRKKKQTGKATKTTSLVPKEKTLLPKQSIQSKENNTELVKTGEQVLSKATDVLDATKATVLPSKHKTKTRAQILNDREKRLATEATIVEARDVAEIKNMLKQGQKKQGIIGSIFSALVDLGVQKYIWPVVEKILPMLFSGTALGILTSGLITLFSVTAVVSAAEAFIDLLKANREKKKNELRMKAQLDVDVLKLKSKKRLLEQKLASRQPLTQLELHQLAVAQKLAKENKEKVTRYQKTLEQYNKQSGLIRLIANKTGLMGVSTTEALAAESGLKEYRTTKELSELVGNKVVIKDKNGRYILVDKTNLANLGNREQFIQTAGEKLTRFDFSEQRKQIEKQREAREEKLHKETKEYLNGLKTSVEKTTKQASQFSNFNSAAVSNVTTNNVVNNAQMITPADMKAQLILKGVL